MLDICCKFRFYSESPVLVEQCERFLFIAATCKATPERSKAERIIGEQALSK